MTSRRSAFDALEWISPLPGVRHKVQSVVSRKFYGWSNILRPWSGVVANAAIWVTSWKAALKSNLWKRYWYLRQEMAWRFGVATVIAIGLARYL
jgi:hypothetical protein